MTTVSAEQITPPTTSGTLPAKRVVICGLAVLAVLLVGILLRVYRIQDESISRDELACAAHLHHTSLSEYLSSRERDDPSVVMPLYFIAQYFWAKCFGLSPTVLRILPLLFSIATLLILYDFGRRLHGHTAGLVAMLCASCSKLLVFESQELRMYAFTFLFAVLSVYALWRALYDGPRYWWRIHVLATACLVWTHILALPLLVVEGLFLLCVRPRQVGLWVRWGVAVSIPILATPFHILTATEAPPRDEMGWLPLPWRARLISTFLYTFTGAKMDHFDPLVHAWGGPIAAILLAALFVAAGLWLAMRILLVPSDTSAAEERARLRHMLVLLATWLLFPPIALYITSHIVRPCYIERYVYLSAFAAYLGLGFAIASLPSRGLRVAACAVLATLYAVLATDMVRPLRPDFVNGIAYINQNATPDDAFAATDVNSRNPTNYYLNHGASPVLTPEEFPDYVLRSVGEGKQTWAVYYAEYPIEPKGFEARLRDAGIHSDVRIFPGWQDLRVYRLTRNDS